MITDTPLLGNEATRFKPGNKRWLNRLHHNGGRLPASIQHIQEALERYPERTGKLLDKIYNLAIYGDGKLSLMAAIDYLDRMGFRTPKESTLLVKGMIAIGSPEDYRRAALLLQADRETEAKLLPGHNSNSANNQIQDEAMVQAVEGEVTDYDNDTAQTGIVQSASLGTGQGVMQVSMDTPLSEAPTLSGGILEADRDPENTGLDGLDGQDGKWDGPGGEKE